MRGELRVLPEPFLTRLRAVVPPQRRTMIVNTFASRKPTTFRVNPLTADPGTVRAQLAKAGFQLERVAWYPDAAIVRRGRLRDLQETEAYRTGAIYVQSLSSMLPPLVLAPKAGESVLDLTAAPGSKTTQLACLMQGEGRIVANDSHRVRFFKLRANIAQQAARNVETTLRYGETFGRRYPEAFDRVLVDAPCSAEGRFQTSEPKSYRFWKPAKIHEMVRKQQRLLASGIETLRPGGILVYSTCTFAPEENEGVVSWALERFGRAVTLEPVTVGCANQMVGLTAWERRRFPDAVRQTRRILPTADMEGFFLARFRKRSGPALSVGVAERETA